MSEHIVCVSGGFDPLHKGHVSLLLGAANFGKLIVILNSDDWIIAKKGYLLMPWTDRRDILMGIKGVEKVVPVDDSDGTVCKALELIKPNVFANGGLRTSFNTPERTLCKNLGIKMVWGIGGGLQEDYSNEVARRIKKIAKTLDSKKQDPNNWNE